MPPLAVPESRLTRRTYERPYRVSYYGRNGDRVHTATVTFETRRLKRGRRSYYAVDIYDQLRLLRGGHMWPPGVPALWSNMFDVIDHYWRLTLLIESAEPSPADDVSFLFYSQDDPRRPPKPGKKKTSQELPPVLVAPVRRLDRRPK